MGKAMRCWRWIPFALGLAIPAAYCLGRLEDIPYLDGFMGNWLATVLGVIVGIPIALAISERERRAQAREEGERQQRVEADRRTQVLQLIRAELQQNLACMRSRKAVLEREHWQPDVHVFSQIGFKDETWRALSDGGHVGCIRDLVLLNSITIAYHWIGKGKHTDQTIWGLYWSPASGAGGSSRLELYILLELLADCDQTIKKTIDFTLQEVDRALEDLGQRSAE